MKKLILPLVLLATVASCQKTEVNNLLPKKEITFSTLNDRTTKSANDLTGESAVDYKVYALASENNSMWYIKDVVNGVTNLANSTYYWPTNETLDFYSYAPANAIIEDEIETAGNVTFNYTVVDNAQEDFTIAVPLLGYNKDNAENKANFTFKHKLSKITINAKLHDKLTAAGYYMVGRSHESAITVNDNKANVDVVAGSLIPIKNTQGTQVTYDRDETNTYYVMPQSTLDCKIAIQDIIVKHNNGSLLFSGDLAEIVFDANNSVTEFVAGTHYTISVTISNDGLNLVPIEFTATESGWDTANGSLAQ